MEVCCTAISRWRHVGNCRAQRAPRSCWICCQFLRTHRTLTLRAARLPTRFRRLGLGSGACRSLDAAHSQQIVPDALDYVHQPRNWHQTGTSQTQKAKKSAGANLLTLVFLGSPTWTRTRDLRINSPSLYRLSYQGTDSNYSVIFPVFSNLFSVCSAWGESVAASVPATPSS